MAAKSKGRGHIYRGGAKKEVKKKFEERYGKKKDRRVHGAPAGKITLA